MLLENSRMTRKQFLQRSAWGFGSAFLLPSLLQSCMKDHDLPNPGGGGGGGMPTLFVPQFNWNDDCKIAVTSVVEMIPVAGDILGGLVDILWPNSQDNVWDEIKDQVEALVDQKIASAVYTQVTEDLQGLNNSLTLYLNELKNGTPATILNQWMITRNSFVVALPHFQSSGNELPLLPLFGQFANLYLGLLRDGALSGASWGMSAADSQQVVTDLTNSIDNFYKYTYNTYATGKTKLTNSTQTNYHLCEPFRTLNTYERQMTLTVKDFMNLWEYFDITTYPDGVPAGVLLDREIHSDPYGTCDDSGAIVISGIPPTQFPTSVTVWGGDRINAVQVTYPAGKGPGGVTTTPRMGAGGGSNQAPRGGVVTVSPSNLIQWAGAAYGDIVNELQFGFQDGTTTPIFGGGYIDNNHPPTSTGQVGYPLELLSSVHINGESSYYASADCVVFGFMYYESPTDKLNALRNLYVKTPKERTAAELTRKLSSGVTGSNLITDELRAARKAYWDALKARADKLK